MPGRATAVYNGNDLVNKVVDLAQELGLESRTQVKVGRRLWGAIRKIDVVLTQPETRRTLGIECKVQSIQGSAEEKIPSTIQDISAWPIPGLVVFAGNGFSPNMRVFLLSTGKAVEFEDLHAWVSLYFGLPHKA
jgi:hypothetical protein